VFLYHKLVLLTSNKLYIIASSSVNVPVTAASLHDFIFVFTYTLYTQFNKLRQWRMLLFICLVRQLLSTPYESWIGLVCMISVKVRHLTTTLVIQVNQSPGKAISPLCVRVSRQWPSYYISGYSLPGIRVHLHTFWVKFKGQSHTGWPKQLAQFFVRLNVTKY